MKIRHFYVIIVIASLHFFLIMLKYKQNNEIRTIRATKVIIVIINVEKKNEMVRQISVEIKKSTIMSYIMPLYYVFLVHSVT